MRREALPVMLAICIAAALGCGRHGPQTSAELVAALKAEGVAYDVAETTALPTIRSDGLRLKGDSLDVEVLRIEKEGELRAAVAAVALVTGLEGEGVGAPELQSYVFKPFLIIVRREPQEGQVGEALKRIFDR